MKNETVELALKGPHIGSKIILEQIEDLLFQFSKEEYKYSIDILSGASIGQHIRHIIDFYSCIIEGTQEGLISYDNRKRKIEIEQDPQFAISCIRIILLELELHDVNHNIGIETRFSSDENELPSYLNSTFGRELMYAVDHAIHHLALVKIGIANTFQYIKMHPEMGVAPSTLRFRRI